MCLQMLKGTENRVEIGVGAPRRMCLDASATPHSASFNMKP